MIDRKPYILAVAGEIAAGKNTIINVFKSIAQAENPSLRIRSIGFSDHLREGLQEIGIPNPSREDLSRFSVKLSEELGPGEPAQIVKQKIEQSLDYDLITLDGMRWSKDGEMVTRLPFDKDIIYVNAHPWIRYARSVTRNEKAGDNLQTYEQFLAAHLAPTEQELIYILGMSDFIIVNNGTMDQLETSVRSLYSRTLGSRYIANPPTSPLPLIL